PDRFAGLIAAGNDSQRGCGVGHVAFCEKTGELLSGNLSIGVHVRGAMSLLAPPSKITDDTPT
ncbi:MAG: hypothetical protein ACKOFW_05380, partial [Planctomycetaceae bacterium]